MDAKEVQDEKRNKQQLIVNAARPRVTQSSLHGEPLKNNIIIPDICIILNADYANIS